VSGCGDVFGFDEENEKAFVITAKGGPEAYPEAYIDGEAIETCPVECIHWE
jgi:ferredoxin